MYLSQVLHFYETSIIAFLSVEQVLLFYFSKRVLCVLLFIFERVLIMSPHISSMYIMIVVPQF